MRNVMRIILMSFVVGSTFTACSKQDLAEDELQIETVATEGDDEKDKNEPGGD
ncbi:hypothetical protein [Pareuzebyella sediminis]|uniref:hypothetical protein n=1 Tax=Pareuzebyella sediminis TaxID=2607998 RepID=UPI0018E0F932|nr:hypothetical protein [Pareuzebyella sediminis]